MIDLTRRRASATRRRDYHLPTRRIGTMSYSTMAKKVFLSFSSKRSMTLGLLLALGASLAATDSHAQSPIARVKSRANFSTPARLATKRHPLGVVRPTNRRTPVPIGTVGPKLEPVNARLGKIPFVAPRRNPVGRIVGSNGRRNWSKVDPVFSTGRRAVPIESRGDFKVLTGKFFTLVGYE